jgi:hypothetical protein
MRGVNRRLLGSAWLVASLALAPVVQAADLQPNTVQAFDRYVALTEAGLDAAAPGALRVDALAEARRAEALAELVRGGIAIERLRTRQGGRDIDVPGGLIHHWVGTVFVPGSTTEAAVRLLQDYDRHAEIYPPAVQRSKVLSRDGDMFTMFLRFYQKKVISVVVNSEHSAIFSRPTPGEASARIRSTRIAEVENPGTPSELEKPVGRDGGYLWRLNTYWRFVERNAGVFIQCESVTLTRGIPIGLGWLVGPFVTSIPRESLEFTLNTTRKTLLAAAR